MLLWKTTVHIFTTEFTHWYKKTHTSTQKKITEESTVKKKNTNGKKKYQAPLRPIHQFTLYCVYTVWWKRYFFSSFLPLVPFPHLYITSSVWAILAWVIVVCFAICLRYDVTWIEKADILESEYDAETMLS